MTLFHITSEITNLRTHQLFGNYFLTLHMSNHLNLTGATQLPPNPPHTLGSFKPESGWYKAIMQNWSRITALLITDYTTFITTEHQFLHYKNKDTTHLAEFFWSTGTHTISCCCYYYSELPHFKHNYPFYVHDSFKSFQSN